MVGVYRRRHRRHFRETTAIAAFILLHFFFSVTGTPFSNFGVGSEPKSEDESGSGNLPGRVLFQRRFGGPGSSPPTCQAKCGGCAPCIPVRVPVQPELSMPLEYYPEVWRCKCGDKLFMP